ncbi:MAG: AAA family ATPase [Bacteroidales bacterium]|nr:AAA family ATPase [Bacteroidales bacterium]
MAAFILDNFGFKATKEQEKAAERMSQFIFQHDADSLFVLKGFAGTGKTSLVGALVRSMDVLKQRTVLMAPTGRAAKVFALHAHHPAFTIHKRIYRQKSFTGSMTDFLQNVNLMKHTLFIVDEASMISNESRGGSVFGTGRLLDDLIQFVYSGEGCRLMLVGDTAQLPPVGEELSPALDAVALGGYGLHVEEMTLTEVVRQLSDSGILWNATLLRRMMSAGETQALPHLRFQGFADVVAVPGNELIEALEQAYWQVGQDQTIVVTRSNVRANAYNQGIRGRILGLEEELTSGDQLMVVKNNYHWIKAAEDGGTAAGSEREAAAGSEGDVSAAAAMDFIANGDVAVVRRLRNERSVHGFRFADVSLRFPDYDDVETDATILLDTLASEAPTLTHEQQEVLFQKVWDDYPEITTKRERMAAVKADPFFNALQVKYAYAITCHKAQGGQWQRVFIDQGYVTEEMLTPEYFRWLYTALTRATERVCLVNWPEGQSV